MFAICATTGDPKRTWPLEKYEVSLGKILSGFSDGIILLVGGTDAIAPAKTLEESCPERILNLAGKTSLIETYELLKNSNILITGDTGVMHLGDAAGTPIVEISCHPKGGVKNHPNSPSRFGPYKAPHRIIQPEPDTISKDWCAETNNRFINKISAEEVFEAVKALV